MSDETQKVMSETFHTEGSKRIPQTKGASQQKPPGSNSSNAPQKDAAVFVSWLSMTFPQAAAREEQIRQAALSAPKTGGASTGEQEHAQYTPATQDFSKVPRQSAKDDRSGDGRHVVPDRPPAYPSAPDDGGVDRNEKVETEIADWRMQTAADIARTNDPDKLAQRVRQELHLAASGMAIPSDKLPALRTELAGYKPGNTAYREIVERECERAETEWARQGRAHDVFDPLMDAAVAGDWDKFEAVLIRQFALLAGGTPTTRAVENHMRMLLAYGLPSSVFQAVVKQAAANFLIEAPRRAVVQVDEILRTGGPLAASAKLRHLTDPEAADPLSAGQIFSRAETSIAEIVSHMRAFMTAGLIGNADGSPREIGAEHSPAAGASSMFAYAQQSQVFANLNAAAESASRSEQGLRAMRHLARLLQMLPVDTFVIASISNGDGILLPLEIARLRAENVASQEGDGLARHIEIGIRELLEKIRGAVTELDDTGSLLAELVTTSDAQTHAGQGRAAPKWRQAYLAAVKDFDAQLANLNRYGYALARAMRSLDAAEPWLDRLANHEALRKLRRAPDNQDFKELRFVLETMPASLSELLRQDDADLPDSAAGDPYLRLHGSSVALQGFQDFRHFLNAAYPETADASA